MLADAVRQVEVVGWDVVNEGVVGLLSIGKHNGVCIGVWSDGVNHAVKVFSFCHGFSVPYVGFVSWWHRCSSLYFWGRTVLMTLFFK